MIYGLVYLFACVLVGLLGIGQNGGFVFYFLLSIITSPILSLAVMIITSRRPVRGWFRWHQNNHEDQIGSNGAGRSRSGDR
jgi:hypothetical protein